MAMGLSTYHAALHATRYTSIHQRQMSSSLAKLSSGSRINVASDGPADLVISEHLRAQTVGLKRAIRNSSEATNVLGVAEGALNEMNAILRKMKGLAIHALNSGVTNRAQVEADQAELDAGLNTLRRIADTTRFGEQLLLNGSQSLLFQRETKSGNALVDATNTRIDHIVRRDGNVQSLHFAGETETGDAAHLERQATKASLEAGVTDASRSQIDAEENALASDQVFRLAGRLGAREFAFGRGTGLDVMVNSINNVRYATGVEAHRTLAGTGVTRRGADVVLDNAISGSGGGDVPEGGANIDNINAGQTLIFGNDADLSGNRIDGLTWGDDPVPGKGTDGTGNIYTRWTDNGDGTFHVGLYKREADPLTGTWSGDDLVAEGSGDIVGGATTVAFEERNESGVNGTFALTLAGGVPADAVLATHSVDRIAGGTREARLDLKGADGSWGLAVAARPPAAAGAAGNRITLEMRAGPPGSALDVKLEGDADSGYGLTVTLATDPDTGEVTSTDVDVANLLNARYGAAGDPAILDVTPASPPPGGAVEARARHHLTGGLDPKTAIRAEGALDRVESMAASGVELGSNTDEAGRLHVTVESAPGTGRPTAIRVYKSDLKREEDLVASWEGAAVAAGGTYYLDEENGSNLRIALLETDTTLAGGLVEGESVLAFDQGVRLSSLDYGQNEYIQLEAREGSLWDAYDATHPDADRDGYVNLSIDTVGTYQAEGSGARLSLNGFDLFTEGLALDASGMEMGGKLAFRAGEIGFTTLAQVGYDRGLSTSASGHLHRITNLAANAGTNTREDLLNFTNGMRLQLGGGSHEQNRTVYGIPAMDPSNLGKVAVTSDFDGDGTEETKTLTLSDVIGGGLASLSNDAQSAWRILETANVEVSSLRARLGSTQRDMLQTNTNHLRVAIENITKSESAIRDTDMAQEMATFTRDQIALQASTAMLAQANASHEPVLPQLAG